MSTVQSTTNVFTASMEKQILNLATSDQELINIAERVFGEKGSSLDQQKFQLALQSRAHRATAWSNLLRTLSELQRSVIQNLRL